MLRTVLFIVVLLLIFAVTIRLQVFLSAKQKKWPGLLLPVICLVISVIATVSYLKFIATPEISEITFHPDDQSSGQMHETVVIAYKKQTWTSMLAQGMPVFIIMNIPTLILLAVYFACREKIKRRTELDKMNIQDLE